jgi:glycosyltransferase involved in cell wall biosynthesis
LRVDWDEPRAQLLEWARPPYDLIWFEHAHTWAGLAGAVPGPTVVDLDNLEDRRLRQRRLARRSTGERGEGSWARRAAASLLDPIDVRRWGRLQRGLANDVAAVLLCSDLDRERLGAPNAVVVPNGYSLAGEADVPPGASSRAPVLVMISLLTYEPNVDGAWFFVDEVLPLVRAAVPEVELRLVGRHDDRVAALADRPGVVLRGEVEDVRPELRDAALVVVPIRSGGGTRIKILEAFARRVPVVSTTIGCEGIDAVPGEHLLVGDTPDALANACVQLLRDDELRTRVIDAAHALFVSRYRWEDIRPRVAALARAVAAGSFSAPARRP